MTAHPAATVAPLVAADEANPRIAHLFDVHQEALYRLARRLTNTAEDARDLIQDTFLRAARDVRRIPAGHSPEQAWLVRVMINLQRDQWRKDAVRQRARWRVNPATTGNATQESAVIARTMVWTALNRLHPRRRAVLVLHELEGTDGAAIAALLGIRPITVRWHLSRGRRELTRLLAPHVGGPR